MSPFEKLASTGSVLMHLKICLENGCFGGGWGGVGGGKL